MVAIHAVSWGLVICAALTNAEDVSCHLPREHAIADPVFNLLQRNSSQGSPVAAIEAGREAGVAAQEPAGDVYEGGDGQPKYLNKPCPKNGLRLELYLRPPLRFIHNSRQGPVGAFMAELKARILYALDLPPEQVQMLGIRGQSLGKEVDFNMMQVSDTTYINATFTKTETAFIAMLEEMQANGTLDLALAQSTASQEPETAAGYPANQPVVIEGVIRRANAETSSAGGSEPAEVPVAKEEGVERRIMEGGEEEAPSTEGGREEAPSAEGGEMTAGMEAEQDSPASGYSSGWRTDDDWRSKLGTVDPKIWDTMTANGIMGSMSNGLGDATTWRSWDPKTGRWMDNGKRNMGAAARKGSGFSTSGGYGAVAGMPGGSSGSWGGGSSGSWGGGAWGGSGGSGEDGGGSSEGRDPRDQQYDGMSYQTVVDFEIMAGYGGEAPVWVTAALREETYDPNGRLMRGSLAPILANAKLMVGGKNRGSVDALIQESAASTSKVSLQVVVLMASILALRATLA